MPKGEEKEIEYPPRPVMEPTSKEGVNAFVTGYKMNREVPIVGDNINHATRYWAVAALYTKYPGHFKLSEMCRFFKISDRVFRGKYASKMSEGMEKYGYLSPSEYFEKSRKSTIEKYGRKEDVLKFYAKRNKY